MKNFGKPHAFAIFKHEPRKGGKMICSYCGYKKSVPTCIRCHYTEGEKLFQCNYCDHFSLRKPYVICPVCELSNEVASEFDIEKDFGFYEEIRLQILTGEYFLCEPFHSASPLANRGFKCKPRALSLEEMIALGEEGE